MCYFHNKNAMLMPKFQNKGFVYFASQIFVGNFTL